MQVATPLHMHTSKQTNKHMHTQADALWNALMGAVWLQIFKKDFNTGRDVSNSPDTYGTWTCTWTCTHTHMQKTGLHTGEIKTVAQNQNHRKISRKVIQMETVPLKFCSSLTVKI